MFNCILMQENRCWRQQRDWNEFYFGYDGWKRHQCKTTRKKSEYYFICDCWMDL